MHKPVIKILTASEIEQCRELCNELMRFQQSKATIQPECFDSMNFDTRMKKSYAQALRSHVAVAILDEQIVGYIFSTIDYVTDEQRYAFPDWAPKHGTGFYPEWVTLPQNIGCLNNLYIKENYRHLGLGKQLLHVALAWLESFEDTKLTLVFISNGNNAALDFYLKNNFKFSHSVFDGFISATFKHR